MREEQIRTALMAGERELTIENCIPFTRHAFDFILYEDSEIWPNNAVRDYYGLEKLYGVDTAEPDRSRKSSGPAA